MCPCRALPAASGWRWRARARAGRRSASWSSREARRGRGRDAFVALRAPAPERLLCALASAREGAGRMLSCYAPDDPGAASVPQAFAGAVLARLAAEEGTAAELLREAVDRVAVRGGLAAGAGGR